MRHRTGTAPTLAATLQQGALAVSRLVVVLLGIIVVAPPGGLVI